TPPSIDSTGKLTYHPAADTNGTATVTVVLHDNGSGTAPNVNTSAAQTVTITVNAVNDAPERTAGSPSPINVDADSANSAAVSLGLSALDYGPGGGADEANQTLTYKITNIPSFVKLFMANGTSAVEVDDTLTLDELQGLTYETVAGAIGAGNITWKVQDDDGVANGGADTLTENLAITVGVNDPPVRTAGNPAAINVNEDADNTTPVTLGLAGLTYGPGGGAEEATQTL